MTMTLCAKCAQKMRGTKQGNSIKDICQVCGKKKWTARYDVYTIKKGGHDQC